MFLRSYVVQMSTYTAKASLVWNTYHSCDSMEEATSVRDNLCKQLDPHSIRIVESFYATDSDEDELTPSIHTSVMHKDNVVLSSNMRYNAHSSSSTMVAIA